jgi:hypothetical protein
MAVKCRLTEILQALLAPIRERREALARDPGYVLGVLRQGTASARGPAMRQRAGGGMGMGPYANDTAYSIPDEPWPKYARTLTPAFGRGQNMLGSSSS